jgi:hypothetical protein
VGDNAAAVSLLAEEDPTVPAPDPDVTVFGRLRKVMATSSEYE